MVVNNRPRGRLRSPTANAATQGGTGLRAEKLKNSIFFNMDFFRNRVRYKAPTVVNLRLCAHQIEIILASYDRCLSSLALKKIEQDHYTVKN